MAKNKKTSENTEEKKYTKRAIVMNIKGVKKDILNSLLSDELMYSLTEVDTIYNQFLGGGK